MPRTSQGMRLGWAATLLLSVGLSRDRPALAERSALSLPIEAGSARTFEVPLSADPFPDRLLAVRLAPTGSWPPSRELEVRLVPGREGESTAPVGLLPFHSEGRRLSIRVQASPCSATQEVRGVVEVWVAASRSEPARKLHDLPFQVQVASSAAACSVTRGAPLLAGTVTLALIVYPLGMWLNSRFLSPRELINRISHQKKEVGADWQTDRLDTGEVRQAVRRDLHLGRRAWAWVRANPLCFGLPGGTYEECVRIRLNRNGTISFELQPERDFLKRAGLNRKRYAGQLLAAAGGERGLTFLGEPDDSARICELELEPAPSTFRWKRPVLLVYRRASENAAGPGPSKAWKILAR